MLCTTILEKPWLIVSLPSPLQILSWSINRPGRVLADTIVWREVRNADLPQDLDVVDWLNCELIENGQDKSVAMLTSRSIEHYVTTHAVCGDCQASCVATVGLSNAERVGHRVDRTAKNWGTINILTIVNMGLTEAAQIEAMSIVAQARTAALCDANIQIETGIATGTGTDCIAIAAPEGLNLYAGLHTDIGVAIGKATYDAIARGIAEWR
ncbi:MAG: adenosylcobinamide amidohydrolase [Cohaesibacter sp.]|jgi:adenosylcobinamide amidohydrolase|nr:adenosylcobinamide amidohydrolase [Cohaesibacter sp.]